MIIKSNDPFTEPSFSFRNRLARAVWGVCYILLFRFSPRPFHVWRRLLLIAFGAHIEKGVHVYPGVKIWAPWLISVKKEAGVADGVMLYSMAKITIGERAVISQNAHLCTGSHDYASANFQLFARPIVIGDRAWVCADAFIGPGVTVGDGAVVGARAVVSRDVLPWNVVAGNPAKPIKLRRSPDLIQ